MRAGAVDVPGGGRDEAAPSGMQRAALVAELVEERDEPIHDAVRLQVRAARRPVNSKECGTVALMVSIHENVSGPCLLYDAACSRRDRRNAG